MYEQDILCEIWKSTLKFHTKYVTYTIKVLFLYNVDIVRFFKCHLFFTPHVPVW